MFKKSSISIFLVSCLSISLFAIDVDKALEFLRMQFVKEAALLRASTIGNDARTCYIASDNLLAVGVFRIFDDPLFYKIRETLDKFGGGVDGRHEMLFGINTGKLFFYTRYNEVVDLVFGHFGNRVAPGRIIYELPNKTEPVTSWNKYADLIVYKALDDYYNGNLKNASRYFERLMSLWDGHGFRDAPYLSNGLYETFKLSLAVYLYRFLSLQYLQLRKYEPMITRIKEIISSMQDLNGGIVTNYKYDDLSDKYIPMGDVNVETTCMTLLAFSKKLFKRKEISKILEIENGSIKMNLTDPNSIAIVFESPKLGGIRIYNGTNFREIKRFSKDIDSIICWLGPSELEKNVELSFSPLNDNEAIDKENLKVYVISLERLR